MRKINIVLFSSGVSEKNGILDCTKKELEKRGYVCMIWRDIFIHANDSDNIALLPMLIKKIPTFDYAVLICEGHDVTKVSRNGRFYEMNTMRDNVVFEIGLCAMGLGLSKTVLLTDKYVHLPEDLQGTGNKVALKQIIYSRDECQVAAEKTASYIEDAASQVDEYIKETRYTLSPVVVGAASATACGYVTNFILRTLEKVTEGVILDGTEYVFDKTHIFMHIILPVRYTHDTQKKQNIRINELKKGIIPSARSRQVEFRYVLKDDELHIYDYPTSIVTSYETAMMILDIDADDTPDIHAQDRFTAKEIDLFETTVKMLLKKPFIEETIRHIYQGSDEQKIKETVDTLVYLAGKVECLRIDY